jgi:hypothetical protein
MQNKKPYKKPEIARVEMKPEDAVLTACKTNRAGPGRKTWCNKTGPKCSNQAQGS